MNGYFTSIIRTTVPLLVAYLVGWLASLGITVTSEQQAAIAGAIGTVAAALYYAAVRWAAWGHRIEIPIGLRDPMQLRRDVSDAVRWASMNQTLRVRVEPDTSALRGLGGTIGGGGSRSGGADFGLSDSGSWDDSSGGGGFDGFGGFDGGGGDDWT